VAEPALDRADAEGGDDRQHEIDQAGDAEEQEGFLGHPRGDAGLALYPESEDILAITSLLAVVREDWPQAVDLLRQLIDMQGAGATVFTHSMLIRSLRCNLDLAEAFEACGVALAIYPDHPELLKEYDALSEALGLGAVQRV